MRHSFPEFSDLKVHLLPEISNLAIHTPSRAAPRRFVGDLPPGRRFGVDGPQLVAVEEFHRECVRVAARLKVRPDRFQSR